MDTADFASLEHHHIFGAKGDPPTERVTPEERFQVKPFAQPTSASWDQPIPGPELSKMLLGFAPQDMDDKWLVYTLGPDGEGKGTVCMFRSWTGYQMIEANFVVEAGEDGEDGKARFTDITWEDSKERYNADTDAESAKKLAKNVCQWCMDVKLP